MDEWMLNDLLECSVCLERLDTSSKVLPCQHTFCRKCLEEIVSTHKELRCPECRILVELRIDELPPNVLLMRILEGMRNAPKKKGVTTTASTSARPMPTMLQQQQQGFTPNPHNPQNQQQSPGHQHHHRTYLAPHPAAREHHSIRSHHSPKQVVLPNQPCAKALFNYQSRVHGDLNFKKGDIITLKKKIDANWYEGECGGSCGVFPSTYVQVITPLPSHIPQCKALYDFKMTNDDEEGCLTFKKGEVLTVIRRVDENWAEGKLADRIGIFPLAFVELNDVARALVKLSANSQPGPSRVAPPTPTSEDVTPLIPTDHMITTAPNMMASPHYSSPSFHSTPPSQSSPPAATTTVSSSHPAMPLQANQMAGNAAPHHHHQSRHMHHRHHHSQQQAVVTQQQVSQTPTTTVASTPLSSSVSSSTSSSPTSSTSSTPSSSTSASSSSTTATNSPNGSSVPSSVPSSPASPPPPPPPPPLPPSSASSELLTSSSACTTSPLSNMASAEQQPQVHQRGTPSTGPVSPGSSFQLPQQYQREKRHSFNVLHSNQNMPQQTTHRHSAEILSPTTTSAPDHTSEDQVQGQDGQSDCSSSSQSQSKSSQHKHRRSGSDLASTTSSSSQGPVTHTQEQTPSTVMLPATYVALYPYKPQKADELELRKGSVYTVTEKCQDGWFKGTSMRTHKCGVFPGNYVALMRPPAPPPPYNHQQNQFNGSSPPAPMPNHGVSPSARIPSSASSPSRPGNHHASSQATGSPAPSTSSRIPVASSVSPSVQSFVRGKSSMPGTPSTPTPSSHTPNVADGRQFGEVFQVFAPPHSGNVAPPKPPRPHSPHHPVNSPHHHQSQSMPVGSPPPELPPRSSSPTTYHHHFHPSPSLTTSAPPPVLTSSLLSGNTVGTSSSWHACHPSGHQMSAQSVEGLGNRGSPGSSHNTLSTAVTPPPNVSVGSGSSSSTPVAPGPSGRPSLNTSTPFTEKTREKKERGSSGVSLMRRLTSMKSKSKSPPLAPSYSMDNPVFEDGCMVQPLSQSRPSGQMLAMAHTTTQHGSPGTHSVHVRSGSCPSQLLQALPPDGNISEPKHHHRLLCSESQRQKHKERPSVVTANLVLFGRSSPGVIGPENGASAVAYGGSSGSSGGGHRKSNSLDAGTCLGGGNVTGDSGKKSKQLVPQVNERFRCIVAYPPNSEHELELKVGDVIYVHRKRKDGWYNGTLQRTGRTGLFPASFVEAF